MKRIFLAVAIALLVGGGLIAGGLVIYDSPAAADSP
jgi:hypothetical protein